ncbi:sensor histidine kinase [Pararhizobium sp. PWRC1-1]|uniref:sensor histidine kinase n=1 Tax=Pararhizobium sp. PWRC1-1 TaxID=2804566 RepID=UPI003CFA3CE4
MWTDREIDVAFDFRHPVRIDHPRLAQLFSNLLGNALTHGAADAPVRVRASTTPEAFERWVANAGEPIPENSMERLFQPFTRPLDNMAKQGLGLGLYIASQIASAHGGTLSVGSSPAIYV